MNEEIRTEQILILYITKSLQVKSCLDKNSSNKVIQVHHKTLFHASSKKHIVYIILQLVSNSQNIIELNLLNYVLDSTAGFSTCVND